MSHHNEEIKSWKAIEIPQIKDIFSYTRDGVNDKVEYDRGTNPEDEDTDNDALDDRQEIYYYGTYGYTWDSDEDELSDNDEFYNWLFMLYLDGDNNLESEIEDIMWQITMGLNAVGSVSQVKQVIHVVAQYDGRNWGDSARYEIKANTWEWEKVKVEDLGEVAMSAPGTLSGFVNWAVDRIWQPNRRALIIVDHGGGWQGVCWDDSISLDNFTDMQELKQAFENMKVHIDLVEFSACLMQMSEVLYQLQGYTDWVVGNEETGWFNSEQFYELFNHLAGDYASIGEPPGKPIHPEDLANEICLTYSPQVDNYTISSVKMSKVNSELISQINNFAQKLINEINNGMGEEIQSIISQTLHMHVHTKDGDFYNHSYRDLYDFAERIRNNFGAGSSVGRAAWNVMSAIEEAVIYGRYSDKDYHGISIFLPDEVWWGDYYDSYWSKYTSLDFSSASNWDEFLYTLYEG